MLLKFIENIIIHNLSQLEWEIIITRVIHTSLHKRAKLEMYDLCFLFLPSLKELNDLKKIRYNY